MAMGWNIGWEGIYRKVEHAGGGGMECECTDSVGKCILGEQNFFNIKIDLSETIKSHMLNTSLKLTNHK